MSEKDPFQRWWNSSFKRFSAHADLLEAKGLDTRQVPSSTTRERQEEIALREVAKESALPDERKVIVLTRSPLFCWLDLPALAAKDHQAVHRRHDMVRLDRWSQTPPSGVQDRMTQTPSRQSCHADSQASAWMIHDDFSERTERASSPTEPRVNRKGCEESGRSLERMERALSWIRFGQVLKRPSCSSDSCLLILPGLSGGGPVVRLERIGSQDLEVSYRTEGDRQQTVARWTLKNCLWPRTVSTRRAQIGFIGRSADRPPDDHLTSFHRCPITCVRRSPRRPHLSASCSLDTTAAVWTDSASDTPLCVLQATPPRGFLDLDWSLTSHGLLAAISDTHLFIFSGGKTSARKIFLAPENTRFTRLCFFHTFVAAGLDDGSVALFPVPDDVDEAADFEKFPLARARCDGSNKKEEITRKF